MYPTPTTPLPAADSHRFSVLDNRLHIGGQPVSRLAEAVGQTPFYAYDRQRIAGRVADLRAALPPGWELQYAIKANPMPAVVQALAGWVDCFGVASAGELRVALDTGMAPERIGFAGPGKHEPEIAQAVAAGIPQATPLPELGRCLVGEAGVYVCRVVDRKLSHGEVFLVTDGGLHHHLAASGLFGQAVRRNHPLVLANRMAPDAAHPLETVNVVGPLCTALDLLGDHLVLPRAELGDLVAILASGAYGLTASPQRFLSHPAALEALV